MSGIDTDRDEFFGSFSRHFSSDVGKVFHILVPNGKHARGQGHDLFEFAIVHVHQTLTAHNSEQLVVEILGYSFDKRQCSADRVWSMRRS